MDIKDLKQTYNDLENQINSIGRSLWHRVKKEKEKRIRRKIK